jgi:hypothetical protein
MKQLLRKHIRDSLEKQRAYQGASPREKEHLVLLLADSIEQKYKIRDERDLHSRLTDIEKEIQNVLS